MAKKLSFHDIITTKVDVEAKKAASDASDILDKISDSGIKQDWVDLIPEVKMPGSVDDFTSQQIKELQKCMDPELGVYHFAKNYIYVLDPMKGMVQWEPRKYQLRLLRAFLEHRFNIIMASRQIGKSTVSMIFLLWKAMFFDTQIIAILAHKADGAKDVLSRIKDAYELLPAWMKPGAVIYNRMSIEFENGSKIIGNSTTKDAIRGKSCSYVYLDEFAHVQSGLAQEFWISNYPTISTGGHIIIVSTPNGVGNLYHQLWMGALNKKNRFNWEQVDWWEVPGRDEAWKEETIAQLGSIILFNQEHGNKFIGSVETLIDHKVLEQLVGTLPLIEEDEGKFKIWEEPIKGRTYIIGVDTAEGKEQDHSVALVFDCTKIPWIQVAKYKSNTISLVDWPYKLNEIGTKYNDAWLAVEANNQGQSVLADLAYDLAYENLVHMNKKRADMGIFSHKKNRSDACGLLKKVIENFWVVLVDDETISELMDFGPKGGKYQGLNGKDDLVMSALWAIYFNQSIMFTGIAKDNLVMYFDFKTGEDIIDNEEFINNIMQQQLDEENLTDLFFTLNSPFPDDELEMKKWLSS